MEALLELLPSAIKDRLNVIKLSTTHSENGDNLAVCHHEEVTLGPIALTLDLIMCLS